jgi:hypothetical protein
MVATVTLSGSALGGIAPHLLARRIADMPVQVKLGRNRPSADKLAKIKRLSHHFNPFKAFGPPPPVVDWSTKAMISLSRMYLNDQYGDCVIASCYHHIGLWTGNDSDSGGIVTVNDSEVLSTYNDWKAGPGDSGCDIPTVLDNWKSQGISVNGTRKLLDGYVAGDWTDPLQTKVGLNVFGGGKIGIALPQDWTSNAVWDITNSPIVGGHDVCPVKYDSQGVYVASWGRLYLITWRAWVSRNWLEELYFLLAPQWYNNDKLAPNGIDKGTLMQDITAYPNIDPNSPTPVPIPVPVPVPVPTPVPSPGNGYNGTGTINGTVKGLFGADWPITGNIILNMTPTVSQQESFNPSCNYAPKQSKQLPSMSAWLNPAVIIDLYQLWNDAAIVGTAEAMAVMKLVADLRTRDVIAVFADIQVLVASFPPGAGQKIIADFQKIISDLGL